MKLTPHERAYVRYMLATKPAKRHPFRGKHMTVAEIAAATGFSETTVMRRMRQGVDLDAPRRKPGPTRRKYEFRGCSLSIKEIAALTGWSVTKTRTRVCGPRVLDDGEDMHMSDLLRDNLVLLTFKGRTDFLARWAKRLGMTDNVLRKRISAGWSVKRALTEPPMRGRQRIIFYRNRRIIRRIASAFRLPVMTGGSSQTFHGSTGTGAGRQETQFEGKRP